MSEPYRAVKGMNDILPFAGEAFLDARLWAELETKAAQVFRSHAFAKVSLPVIEELRLFQRGIGFDTDVVSKEMYSFTDRGERVLALRPEGTAGAVRAYVEHGLAQAAAQQSWWYLGAMFRAERPQKGRYRQFYQVGAEVFGNGSPWCDVELLALVMELCAAWGIADACLRLNSLGDAESRGRYRDTLRAFLRPLASSLCDNCQRRIDTNALRVLDCKRPACHQELEGAPDLSLSLSPPCALHLATVEKGLTELAIPFVRDPHLVRGLDYYTETIFEVTSVSLGVGGAQDALLGGGRYDGLVADLGGPPTPAIGFAAGLERIALAARVALPSAVDLAIIPVAGPVDGPVDGTNSLALRLAQDLRRAGLAVLVLSGDTKLKQRFRHADRVGAAKVAVIGGNELSSRRVSLRTLSDGSEAEVALDAGALAQAIRGGH